VAAFLHATQINDFIAPNQNPKIFFFDLGFTAHHSRNVKENSSVNHDPSPSVFFFLQQILFIYTKNWGVFCFSGVKLNKFQLFGGNFRQTFDILKI
jgi:hypothetical protein